ncbi:hypothetical protein [Chamaesiphon sp.]|uniref:hypothetical protein n=1 Tax=Chamaesiphon sp. TaxID=2814140 RepID=UPI003593219B
MNIANNRLRGCSCYAIASALYQKYLKLDSESIHEQIPTISLTICHYLAPRGYDPRPRTEKFTHPAIGIVGHLNRGTVEALDYPRSIADEIIAYM